MQKISIPNSASELEEYQTLYAEAVQAFTGTAEKCEVLRRQAREQFEKMLAAQISWRQAVAKFDILRLHNRPVVEAQKEVDAAFRKHEEARGVGQNIANTINALQADLQQRFGWFDGSITPDAAGLAEWADSYARRELPDYVDPATLDHIERKETEAAARRREQIRIEDLAEVARRKAAMEAAAAVKSEPGPRVPISAA